MVIAHKTAVPPERNVNMIQYAGIFDRVIKARIEKKIIEIYFPFDFIYMLW